MSIKKKKTCKQGHTFYKSSDCPTCPACEKLKTLGIFADMGAPVRRALENNNIKTLKQLSKITEEEVLEMHGVGLTAIPKLKMKLQNEGLKFKK